MKYNFDETVNRRDTGSLKWDVPKDVLSMWVADMDFKTAPCILEALKKRVEHGVFGYTDVKSEWNEAYINWWDKRHGLKMKPEWLIFCTGVIPAISSMVRKLTTPNEKVIIQTPVYNIFFNSVLNNGCRVYESPLKYEGGKYYMDFDDLEEKMSDPMATLFILCNPQNPSGNIWSREELKKIGELAVKYNVTVISDEIHCDLTDPGYEYIPFASVSDECRKVSVTCLAPTKTFNIAGIQTAAVCVPDDFLRFKVWRGLNTDEVAEPNVFACEAAIAAFNEGGEWLDELRAYIAENKRIAYDFIKKELPKLHVIESHATYLMWIDISGWDYMKGFKPVEGDAETAKKADPLTASDVLRRKSGLFLSEGGIYGGNGASFLRMNLACPKATVLEGLERLKQAVKD
ncbi:MAG: pyridoxal phosphate-dependent aminotransferase [Lachnospiraceae bacterium]|nr:pyridoxal phosphate-dependent aminotransferase [Lachnospiraceae bacterium]